MEELEIENLNVTIDSEHLLKNICIKINKNEVVGILGESGSGKTPVSYTHLTLPTICSV